MGKALGASTHPQLAPTLYAVTAHLWCFLLGHNDWLKIRGKGLDEGRNWSRLLYFLPMVLLLGRIFRAAPAGETQRWRLVPCRRKVGCMSCRIYWLQIRAVALAPRWSTGYIDVGGRLPLENFQALAPATLTRSGYVPFGMESPLYFAFGIYQGSYCGDNDTLARRHLSRHGASSRDPWLSSWTPKRACRWDMQDSILGVASGKSRLAQQHL